MKLYASTSSDEEQTISWALSSTRIIVFLYLQLAAAAATAAGIGSGRAWRARTRRQEAGLYATWIGRLRAHAGREHQMRMRAGQLEKLFPEYFIYIFLLWFLKNK
jgi:hypothetical protein